MQWRLGFVVFFFFQAEDGIRDRDVTGVQTCALPISFRVAPSALRSSSHGVDRRQQADLRHVDARGPRDCKRSEERRVGKECRYGWEGESLKAKVLKLTVGGDDGVWGRGG